MCKAKLKENSQNAEEQEEEESERESHSQDKNCPRNENQEIETVGSKSALKEELVNGQTPSDNSEVRGRPRTKADSTKTVRKRSGFRLKSPFKKRKNKSKDREETLQQESPSQISEDKHESRKDPSAKKGRSKHVSDRKHSGIDIQADVDDEKEDEIKPGKSKNNQIERGQPTKQEQMSTGRSNSPTEAIKKKKSRFRSPFKKRKDKSKDTESDMQEAPEPAAALGKPPLDADKYRHFETAKEVQSSTEASNVPTESVDKKKSRFRSPFKKRKQKTSTEGDSHNNDVSTTQSDGKSTTRKGDSTDKTSGERCRSPSNERSTDKTRRKSKFRFRSPFKKGKKKAIESSDEDEESEQKEDETEKEDLVQPEKVKNTRTKAKAALAKKVKTDDSESEDDISLGEGKEIETLHWATRVSSNVAHIPETGFDYSSDDASLYIKPVFRSSSTGAKIKDKKEIKTLHSANRGSSNGAQIPETGFDYSTDDASLYTKPAIRSSSTGAKIRAKKEIKTLHSANRGSSNGAQIPETGFDYSTDDASRYTKPAILSSSTATKNGAKTEVKPFHYTSDGSSDEEHVAEAGYISPSDDESFYSQRASRPSVTGPKNCTTKKSQNGKLQSKNYPKAKKGLSEEISNRKSSAPETKEAFDAQRKPSSGSSKESMNVLIERGETSKEVQSSTETSKVPKESIKKKKSRFRSPFKKRKNKSKDREETSQKESPHQSPEDKHKSRKDPSAKKGKSKHVSDRKHSDTDMQAEVDHEREDEIKPEQSGNNRIEEEQSCKQEQRSTGRSNSPTEEIKKKKSRFRSPFKKRKDKSKDTESDMQEAPEPAAALGKPPLDADKYRHFETAREVQSSTEASNVPTESVDKKKSRFRSPFKKRKQRISIGTEVDLQNNYIRTTQSDETSAKRKGVSTDKTSREKCRSPSNERSTDKTSRKSKFRFRSPFKKGKKKAIESSDEDGKCERKDETEKEDPVQPEKVKYTSTKDNAALAKKVETDDSESEDDISLGEGKEIETLHWATRVSSNVAHIPETGFDYSSDDASLYIKPVFRSSSTGAKNGAKKEFKTLHCANGGSSNRAQIPETGFDYSSDDASLYTKAATRSSSTGAKNGAKREIKTLPCTNGVSSNGAEIPETGFDYSSDDASLYTKPAIRSSSTGTKNGAKSEVQKDKRESKRCPKAKQESPVQESNEVFSETSKEVQSSAETSKVPTESIKKKKSRFISPFKKRKNKSKDREGTSQKESPLQSTEDKQESRKDPSAKKGKSKKASDRKHSDIDMQEEVDDEREARIKSEQSRNNRIEEEQPCKQEQRSTGRSNSPTEAIKKKKSRFRSPFKKRKDKSKDTESDMQEAPESVAALGKPTLDAEKYRGCDLDTAKVVQSSTETSSVPIISVDKKKSRLRSPFKKRKQKTSTEGDSHNNDVSTTQNDGKSATRKGDSTDKTSGERCRSPSNERSRDKTSRKSKFRFRSPFKKGKKDSKKKAIESSDEDEKCEQKDETKKEDLVQPEKVKYTRTKTKAELAKKVETDDSESEDDISLVEEKETKTLHCANGGSSNVAQIPETGFDYSSDDASLYTKPAIRSSSTGTKNGAKKKIQNDKSESKRCPKAENGREASKEEQSSTETSREHTEAIKKKKFRFRSPFKKKKQKSISTEIASQNNDKSTTQSGGKPASRKGYTDQMSERECRSPSNDRTRDKSKKRKFRFRSPFKKGKKDKKKGAMETPGEKQTSIKASIPPEKGKDTGTKAKPKLAKNVETDDSESEDDEEAKDFQSDIDGSSDEEQIAKTDCISSAKKAKPKLAKKVETDDSESEDDISVEGDKEAKDLQSDIDGSSDEEQIDKVSLSSQRDMQSSTNGTKDGDTKKSQNNKSEIKDCSTAKKAETVDSGSEDDISLREDKDTKSLQSCNDCSWDDEEDSDESLPSAPETKKLGNAKGKRLSVSEESIDTLINNLLGTENTYTPKEKKKSIKKSQTNKSEIEDCSTARKRLSNEISKRSKRSAPETNHLVGARSKLLSGSEESIDTLINNLLGTEDTCTPKEENKSTKKSQNNKSEIKDCSTAKKAEAVDSESENDISLREYKDTKSLQSFNACSWDDEEESDESLPSAPETKKLGNAKGKRLSVSEESIDTLINNLLGTENTCTPKEKKKSIKKSQTNKSEIEDCSTARKRLSKEISKSSKRSAPETKHSVGARSKRLSGSEESIDTLINLLGMEDTCTPKEEKKSTKKSQNNKSEIEDCSTAKKNLSKEISKSYKRSAPETKHSVGARSKLLSGSEESIDTLINLLGMEDTCTPKEEKKSTKTSQNNKSEIEDCSTAKKKLSKEISKSYKRSAPETKHSVGARSKLLSGSEESIDTLINLLGMENTGTPKEETISTETSMVPDKPIKKKDSVFESPAIDKKDKKKEVMGVPNEENQHAKKKEKKTVNFNTDEPQKTEYIRNKGRTAIGKEMEKENPKTDAETALEDEIETQDFQGENGFSSDEELDSKADCSESSTAVSSSSKSSCSSSTDSSSGQKIAKETNAIKSDAAKPAASSSGDTTVSEESIRQHSSDESTDSSMSEDTSTSSKNTSRKRKASPNKANVRQNEKKTVIDKETTNETGCLVQTTTEPTEAPNIGQRENKTCKSKGKFTKAKVNRVGTKKSPTENEAVKAKNVNMEGADVDEHDIHTRSASLSDEEEKTNATLNEVPKETTCIFRTEGNNVELCQGQNRKRKRNVPRIQAGNDLSSPSSTLNKDKPYTSQPSGETKGRKSKQKSERQKEIDGNEVEENTWDRRDVNKKYNAAARLRDRSLSPYEYPNRSIHQEMNATDQMSQGILGNSRRNVDSVHRRVCATEETTHTEVIRWTGRNSRARVRRRNALMRHWSLPSAIRRSLRGLANNGCTANDDSIRDANVINDRRTRSASWDPVSDEIERQMCADIEPTKAKSKVEKTKTGYRDEPDENRRSTAWGKGHIVEPEKVNRSSAKTHATKRVSAQVQRVKAAENTDGEKQSEVKGNLASCDSKRIEQYLKQRKLPTRSTEASGWTGRSRSEVGSTGINTNKTSDLRYAVYNSQANKVGGEYTTQRHYEKRTSELSQSMRNYGRSSEGSGEKEKLPKSECMPHTKKFKTPRESLRMQRDCRIYDAVPNYKLKRKTCTQDGTSGLRKKNGLQRPNLVGNDDKVKRSKSLPASSITYSDTDEEELVPLPYVTPKLVLGRPIRPEDTLQVGISTVQTPVSPVIWMPPQPEKNKMEANVPVYSRGNMGYPDIYSFSTNPNGRHLYFQRWQLAECHIYQPYPLAPGYTEGRVLPLQSRISEGSPEKIRRPFPTAPHTVKKPSKRKRTFVKRNPKLSSKIAPMVPNGFENGMQCRPDRSTMRKGADVEDEYKIPLRKATEKRSSTSASGGNAKKANRRKIKQILRGNTIDVMPVSTKTQIVSVQTQTDKKASRVSRALCRFRKWAQTTLSRLVKFR